MNGLKKTRDGNRLSNNISRIAESLEKIIKEMKASNDKLTELIIEQERTNTIFQIMRGE